MPDVNYNKFLNDKRLIKVYRGINLDRIRKELNISLLDDIPRQIFDKIFMVGNKANYYIGNKVIELIYNQYGERHRGQEIYSSIEQADRGVFKNIFNTLSEIIIENPFKHNIITPGFLTRNKNLTENLSKWNTSEKYQDHCLDSITELGCEKILIRDYYLSLLHQLEYKSYHRKSALISTSSNRDVAISFMGNKASILIEYIIPVDKVHTFSIPYSIYQNEYLNKIMEELSLPLITEPPYPNEQEYCIKRALFPHFILSLSFYDDFNIPRGKLYNPQIDTDVEHVIRYGFPINQDNFFTTLSQTNYVASGLFKNDFFYEN